MTDQLKALAEKIRRLQGEIALAIKPGNIMRATVEFTDQKSMLCVGGPRAGRRYAVLRGSGFCVPIKEDDPQHPDWQPVKVEFSDYREETFHTPQGDVSFWVPLGQTPLETITLLLETYERSLRVSEPWYEEKVR